MKKGGLIVHAGGERILIDQLPVDDTSHPAAPVGQLLVTDDGRRASIRCVGPKAQGIGEQRIELRRPGHLAIRRETTREMSWWYAGQPVRDKDTLRWPNGTELSVTRGHIARLDPRICGEESPLPGGWSSQIPIRSPILW